MHTLQKNAEEIHKLINGANEVTGIDDTNLTDAVNSLIEKREEIRKNVADEFGIKTSAEGEQLFINDASDLAPLGMNVWGKSWQNNLPSPNPDYPQEIHSLGENGNIEYEIYGGNLFNVNALTLHNEVSVEHEVITINKDTTDFYIWGSFNGAGTSFELKKGVYSLSSNHPHIRISMYYKYDGNIRALDSNAADNTLIENASIHGVRIRSTDGTPLNKTPFTIILNIGSTKCGYMPYLPPQPLTLQTPNGLRGIPVSSGGNYTDANGQQYIADYIDLENGKLVQNIAELYLGDDAKFSINGNTLVTNGYAMVSTSFTAIANKAYTSGSLCNRFGKGSGYMERYSLGYRSAYLWISAERLNGENTTLEDVKEYVKNNPIRILAVRANPIETDLSEDEIAQFKALKMNGVDYDQFTTILNSENAYTKVSYIADTDTYITNLTNSILTLGGEV